MLSSSQAIALAHGATLTNIEFMQMMPGFIEPRRNLVFNEKTWRYVHVDQPVDIADDKLDDLLEQRSGYGPFTSRLASRAIDLVIDQAGVEGLALHYDFPARMSQSLCRPLPLAARRARHRADRRDARCDVCPRR
ncbi:MAG: hypothetical protein ACLU0O_01990 [Collinsella sp.]